MLCVISFWYREKSKKKNYSIEKQLFVYSFQCKLTWIPINSFIQYSELYSSLWIFSGVLKWKLNNLNQFFLNKCYSSIFPFLQTNLVWYCLHFAFIIIKLRHPFFCLNLMRYEINDKQVLKLFFSGFSEPAQIFIEWKKKFQNR